jgi:hypothetical protein
VKLVLGRNVVFAPTSAHATVGPGLLQPQQFTVDPGIEDRVDHETAFAVSLGGRSGGHDDDDQST